ncbi:H2A [Enterospora canceri]|uniref:H2A n=1 Tax=Enterospora canceri TaxID=1081671 RepID=A0A1Y1S9W4_9MICR|nr:H2A [Enterospora canceri]
MPGKSGKRDVKKTSSGDKNRMFFKLTQVKRIMKHTTYMRVSKDAQIAMSSALAYIILELLDGGKTMAQDDGNKKKISPRHLSNAINADGELSSLLKDYVIQSGGCRGFRLPEVTRKN